MTEPKVQPIDITCSACRAQPYELCRGLATYRSGVVHIKTFHHERKMDAKRLNDNAH